MQTSVFFWGTSENQKSESIVNSSIRHAICGEIVTIEAPGVLICGQVGGSLVEKVMDSDPQHMGRLEPPIAVG